MTDLLVFWNAKGRLEADVAAAFHPSRVFLSLTGQQWLQAEEPLVDDRRIALIQWMVRIKWTMTGVGV